jgi:DNA polymerase-3 subunit delta
LPRTRAEDEDGETAAGDPSPLAAYMRDPTPGLTLVFEAARFDFEGDDKRKQERVRKFYGAVPEVVELRRYSTQDAHAEAEALARRAGLRLDPAALALLVEALGADIARIEVEIEKLALYAGKRALTVEDIAALAPEARATTIFALVNALGRRDRARALEILDTLTREGEYLPLALAFLSTQFRMALTAREAGLKSPQQIQGHFTRMGIPMWGSRAEQVYQTASKFAKPQLERGMKLIFEADRGLRDARPDDRVVMEQFVLKLTA